MPSGPMNSRGPDRRGLPRTPRSGRWPSPAQRVISGPSITTLTPPSVMHRITLGDRWPTKRGLRPVRDQGTRLPVGDRAGLQQLAGVTRPTGTVSFLFTDIEGMRRLSASSPQSNQVSALGLHDHLGAIRPSLRTVASCSTAGDGIGASFQRAADAVGAAVALQVGLRRVRIGPTASDYVRVGVHTSEAERDSGSATGEPSARGSTRPTAARWWSRPPPPKSSYDDSSWSISEPPEGGPDEMQLYGVSAEGWRSGDDRPLTGPRPDGEAPTGGARTHRPGERARAAGSTNSTIVGW